MSQSLVLELQLDATNSGMNTTDLLRKTATIAKKLGSMELYDWAMQELNGYTEGQKIPDYRRIHGKIYFFNPYSGWSPGICSDKDTSEKLEVRTVGQPVGELESLVDEADDSLTMYYPAGEEQMVMEIFDVEFRPALFVSRSAVRAVIDRVRTMILEWALKLEELGILGEGMRFSPEEKNLDPSVFNTNFFGPVSSSQIQQATVGSQQTIINFPTEELNKLIDALDANLGGFGVSREKQVQLNTVVQSLKTQMSAVDHHPSKIKECLRSIRNIMEGAAGSLLAAFVINNIDLISKLIS